MRLQTGSPTLHALLASLQQSGESAAVVWLTNSTIILRPLWVEPWGSRILLLPEHTYAAVAGGVDLHDSNGSIRVELSEHTTVWPAGLRGNYIFRHDGALVWDDADPSYVASHTRHPGVTAALRWLAELQEGTVPKQDFVSILKKAVANRDSRDDHLLLLIEHGLVGDDGCGRVSLTRWGQDFLARQQTG